MAQDIFELPIWFDLVATFAFALSGALAAVKRHYDIVGLFFLSFAAGVGGGLMRDGIFIQQGPPAIVTHPRYIECVAVAAVTGVLMGSRAHHFGRLIAIADALGLGAYACFGVQKSLAAGLALPAAILVGVINACGGGLIRDIIAREEPLVFKPGEFYVLTSLAGAIAFAFMSIQLEWGASLSALVAISLTFVFRMLTLLFDWKTTSAAKLLDRGPGDNPS